MIFLVPDQCQFIYALTFWKQVNNPKYLEQKVNYSKNKNIQSNPLLITFTPIMSPSVNVYGAFFKFCFGCENFRFPFWFEYF